MVPRPRPRRSPPKIDLSQLAALGMILASVIIIALYAPHESIEKMASLLSKFPTEAILGIVGLGAGGALSTMAGPLLKFGRKNEDAQDPGNTSE